MERASLRAVRWAGATLALALLGLPVSHQEAEGQAFELEGLVAGTETQEPLQYAVVGIPELQEWTLTDERGYFKLDVPRPGIYRLIVLRRGYYFVDAAVQLEPPDEGPFQILVDLETEREDNPLVPGRIAGQIVDQANGRPVRDAEIRLEPTGETASTNAQGRFEITDISAGAIEVHVSRLGYEERVDTLASFPDVTLNVRLSISADPIELDPVVVEVRSAYLESVGFYRRQQEGFGSYYTTEDIAAINPVYLSDVIRRRPMASVRVGRDDFGNTILTSNRGRGCPLDTWLDNMPMHGFDIDMYPWEAVGAMEVYVGTQTPMQYHTDCGVLLVWSSRN